MSTGSKHYQRITSGARKQAQNESAQRRAYLNSPAGVSSARAAQAHERFKSALPRHMNVLNPHYPV